MHNIQYTTTTTSVQVLAYENWMSKICINKLLGTNFQIYFKFDVFYATKYFNITV
jgi:hypothetical protein